MVRHSSKSRWLDIPAVMAAADKYELKYGFKMRWYLCECKYYHVATVKRHGRRVLSMEAIQSNREEKDNEK